MGYPEWPYPEHQAIAMQDNISIHRSRVAEEAIGRVRSQWLANIHLNRQI